MSLDHSIRSLAELTSTQHPEVRDKILLQIKKIFFDTSARKKFKDAADRETFFNHWTSYYIQNHPLEFLVALHRDDDQFKVLGYLSGCSDSLKAKDTLSIGIKSYPLFSDLFSEYPAHFHINFAAAAQGRGIGSELVSRYKELLKESHIHGVHIITAADARNVSFYFKNGFVDQWERDFMGSRLKFMGCKLDS